MVLLIQCHAPLFGEADIKAEESIGQSQLAQIQDHDVLRLELSGRVTSGA